MLSPDEQVRTAIEHVFALWRRLGSARQALAELVAEGCTLPRRTVGDRRVPWVQVVHGRLARLQEQRASADARAGRRTTLLKFSP